MHHIIGQESLRRPVTRLFEQRDQIDATDSRLIGHPEAAAILTQAGRSPGDLDLIDFVEERSGWLQGVPPSQQASGTAT